MGLKFNIVEPERAGARIKVVGVGGCGNNAINTMIEDNVQGVEFIACNTDKQVLVNNLAGIKVSLGSGLGAGGNPEIGLREAEKSVETLREVLEGADMVFITAGMGGGTGTGAAPMIAKLAREMGALTVGVVTKPFHYEGRRRMAVAEEGIKRLRDEIDTIIVIPNQKLLAVAGSDTTLMDAFKKANDVLLKGVRSLSDLIVQQGHVNLDFADVRSVMKATNVSGELALMGTGQATGEKRAVDAAAQAISCPLMENVSIDGARGVLINITGGFDLRLSEVSEAAELVMKSCSRDAEIYWGQVIDENMREEIRVTVIATGFDEANEHVVERTVPTYLNRSTNISQSEYHAAFTSGKTITRPEPFKGSEEPTAAHEHAPINRREPPVIRRPDFGKKSIGTMRTNPSQHLKEKETPDLRAAEDAYDLDVPAIVRRRKPD